MAMKFPQSMVKSVAIKGPCWLETGTCRLRLQRWNHGHYNCWTSQPLERNSGWISEKHSFCGKNGQSRPSDSQIFQVMIFFFFFFNEPKFLSLLIPRMAIHSSILAWRIPWTDSPWGRKESDKTEWLSLHFTSHTYRNTNIMGQCLVLILLSSLSSRHLDSSSAFMHF